MASAAGQVAKVLAVAMELTGAALRRSALPSASPVAARVGRRRRPARVACVGGGGFAEEGHLRYYEAAPRRKAVEAVARDLGKLRAMGLVAGDAAKEKVLSVSPLFLHPPLPRLLFLYSIWEMDEESE